MNLQVLTKHKLFRPALGAILTVLCGLAVWNMPLGGPWENVSYDYLFRFGARSGTNELTNELALILIDDAACKKLNQVRTNWDRGLHTQLLTRLSEDRCPLTVFDVFFGKERSAEGDEELANAMRQHGRVILMSKLTDPKHPGSRMEEVLSPLKIFLEAAAGCGVAKTDCERGETARRHWPFPAFGDGPFLSLPWVAACFIGAHLSEEPQEQWLRYYDPNGAWKIYSYHLALSKPRGYFRDKLVFIGAAPESTDPNVLAEDKFKIPFTSWGERKAVGGVEVLTTAFLNLVNGDWLRRPPRWLEGLMLGITGLLLGGGLSYARPRWAWFLAIAAALVVTLGAVSLSSFTNYWFPWAMVAGAQVPCALACTLVASRVRSAQTPKPSPVAAITVYSGRPPTIPVEFADDLPETPDYELFDPPFGRGAYGKVWLARNAIGQWQALKTVYLNKFGLHPEPYEREFSGIRRYKPVSDKHPGLLRVDFVSTKKAAGYFYYVMELGDAIIPGWEQDPANYTPLDLSRKRTETERKRLPARECVRIGLALAEALEFLHSQGLTHRDIKPQNIIFVKGMPKLADVGLVADILPPGQERTWVGTPGYMPPPPEPPGTLQADLYGLGMVLYVICTGKEPGFFPEVSTSLVGGAPDEDFLPLNGIILKACQPDRALRYATAAEFAAALAKVQTKLARVMPA